jgi:hypothetical protein
MFEQVECATQDSSDYLAREENKKLKIELEMTRKLLQAMQANKEPQQRTDVPAAPFSTDIFKADFNRGIEVIFTTIKFLNTLNWESRHLLVSMLKNL